MAFTPEKRPDFWGQILTYIQCLSIDRRSFPEPTAVTDTSRVRCPETAKVLVPAVCCKLLDGKRHKL
jgi:hypothetical protein